MNIIFEKIKEAGIIPVVTVDHPDSAIKTAQALFSGGIRAMEITMRTEAGIKAIASVSAALPEMLVGAGTVLTEEAANSAINAGAQFLVSPGLNPEVAELSRELDIVYIPGIVTPTELEQAMQMGFTTLKFFPAEAFGGVSTIKALSAPYPMVKFMPTGGITVKNMAEYLNLDCVLACGASFITGGNLIESGDFMAIAKGAEFAMDAVRKIREARG